MVAAGTVVLALSPDGCCWYCSVSVESRWLLLLRSVSVESRRNRPRKPDCQHHSASNRYTCHLQLLLL